MMDVASSGGDHAVSMLWHLLWYLVLTIVVQNLLFRMSDYTVLHSQAYALRDLTDYALEKLQKHSYRFYSNALTGSLVAKVKRFVRAFEELHDQVIFHIWMNGIALVSAIAVLWYNSWQLGVIFLVWLLSFGILVNYMVRWSIPKTLARAEADSATTAHLADIITNILTVKMFGATELEQRNFAKTTDVQARTTKAAWMQNGFWNPMFQGASINMFEIVIVAASIALLAGHVASPGLLLLVVLYVTRSFNIVWSLGRNVLGTMQALTDANEMVEVFDEPAEVQDPATPEPVSMSAGHIVFQNVAHAYDGNGDVFRELNLDIASGEKVALVGHSGAGKTTVVKLLLRFIDVTDGAITIDGQDIRNVPQDDLRRHIAYVPQEPILFHRTLFENIAYGKNGATREEVEQAAIRARAHDFISALPKGYDTLVGERGIKLSGGERQRVAIARAMLKDAPIVVLDEATSSLDSLSERAIQEGFDELMKGRTTIVIAHRLSTIQHMDRIIILESGGIAEQGTHAELLARSGIYAGLWNSQVGGFLAT